LDPFILVAMIAWHSSKISLIGQLKLIFKKKAPSKDVFMDDYHEEVQDDLFDLGEARAADSDTQMPQATAPQIFCINLKAAEGKSFGGEQLVVQLNRAGLRFGQFDIFHYDDLFSMASAFEPGTFDLNRLDSFRTSGLTFFMETAGLPNVKEAFETMLNTAQHLAEILRADLFNEKWQPLNEAALGKYYDLIDVAHQNGERSEAIQGSR
jgi:FtsZ-interacting cell division protein ZipA